MINTLKASHSIPSTTSGFFGSEKEKSLSPFQLASYVVQVCSEAKGKDVSVLDMSQVSCLTDFFVIISAKSDRQVQGISNKIISSLRELGVKPLDIEGIEEGRWVILDYGDIVIHVFYEATRQHYDIESLWCKAKKLNVEHDKEGIPIKLTKV